MIWITDHAIQRFRTRCGRKLTNSQAVNEIRFLIDSAESFKLMARGRILISNGWALIQTENQIVTVYKGSEKSVVRKRIRNKNLAKPNTGGRRLRKLQRESDGAD